MTKDKALYAYLNRFMTFYPATAVPEDAAMPYGTYELVFGAFGDGPLNMVVNLWFRTGSEAIPNAKVLEISKALGFGGAIIPCDEGYIYLSKGSPFAQAVTDVDNHIKRRYINFSVEYITFY